MEQSSALLDESTSEKPYRYRILVVDDNEGCAKTLMWTMEILGHEAQCTLDGYSAIEIAKTFQPEVVLLDIGLPVMNGYEICQAMRNIPALQHTVFIAQTGWGDKEHQERSKKAGFNYHLVKPISIETLKIILLDIGKSKIPYNSF